MKRVVRLCEWLTSACGAVSTLLIALIAVPMIYDVIMRSWGRPTIWAYEVTTYFLVAATFLANAYTFRDEKHFRATFLITAFPRLAPFLNRFALATTIAFGAIVSFSGSRFALEAFWEGQRSATLLHVPLYLTRLAIPVGAFALTLQAIGQLLSSNFAPGRAADMPE
jgi:C4-dicarboxylate transporter DctQ subunit